jgi:hypothetical protein
VSGEAVPNPGAGRQTFASTQPQSRDRPTAATTGPAPGHQTDRYIEAAMTVKPGRALFREVFGRWRPAAVVWRSVPRRGARGRTLILGRLRRRPWGLFRPASMPRGRVAFPQSGLAAAWLNDGHLERDQVVPGGGSRGASMRNTTTKRLRPDRAVMRTWGTRNTARSSRVPSNAVLCMIGEPPCAGGPCRSLSRCRRSKTDLPSTAAGSATPPAGHGCPAARPHGRRRRRPKNPNASSRPGRATPCSRARRAPSRRARAA